MDGAAKFCAISGFLDIRFGKGVVPAKTARILSPTASALSDDGDGSRNARNGFTPTEVDQMTGKAIGHASSATFRTADLVGLDVLAHVNKNLYPAIPDDEDREVFKFPI
jgi:3-hydroxyacyl-CoA dehydrogenase